MSKANRVLFIVPYPVRHAPSQRFRVELFEPDMQAAGIDYTIAPFMDEHTWKILYKQGSAIQKAAGIIKGFLKRFKTALFDVHKYDVVFVHREASPIGPPIFEWIIAKLWGKKMIYDFDDAIWIPNTSNENKLIGWVKAFWKVKHICKWSYAVIGGNDYLCNYARQYNDHVVLVPTCVDMQRMHNGIKEHHNGQVVIGWTGSHSTIPYLNEIMPALVKIEQECDTKFILIANKQPDLPLKNWEFIPWNEQTEIADLLKIDIGVMPLKVDTWSEGKCGFKLIQYLSLGIPAVASPVGVNRVIVEEGTNGFLCTTHEEWLAALRQLVTDASLRKNMGTNGRNKMLNEYSVAANKDKLIQLLKMA